VHDLVVIAPWLATPWERTVWVDPGDDPSRLEVKKKALARYASAVLRPSTSA